MRGFGVYLHGYKTKHYKEDVRKYLFWINSLGGSVLRRVDSNKPKVHIRHGQSYFGTLNHIPIKDIRSISLPPFLCKVCQVEKKTGYQPGNI